MGKILFEKGDIVLNYRPVTGLISFIKNFIQWGIRFFTTDFYTGEKFSTAHHVEMVYSSGDLDVVKDISEEPPYVKVSSFNTTSLVYRLIIKPTYFDSEFDNYAEETLKYKVGYDYRKFFAFVLNWFFRTVKFTEWFSDKNKNVCSTYVAKFYEERVKIKCARNEWVSTTPDDVVDYVQKHTNLFSLIYDGWNVKQ